jgi:hypothetical protein
MSHSTTARMSSQRLEHWASVITFSLPIHLFSIRLRISSERGKLVSGRRNHELKQSS